MRRFVRPEELVLGLLLLLSAALCLKTGTGFDLTSVFKSYVGFFAGYFLLVLFITRVLFVALERQAPGAGTWAAGLRHRLFGTAEGKPSVVATDWEFARGSLLLFVTLTVYSNLKVRIPFLNDTVGDPLFLAMDQSLLGERLVPALERLVAGSPALRDFFERVYMHDYLFMVVLIFAFYLRRDTFKIRWTFISICYLYILGVLWTAAYPSYGPCFLEPARFAWLEGTRIGGAQAFLKQFYLYSQNAVEKGGTFQARAFAGIAAFPSLHVGHMVALLVVAARGWRPYAWLMGAMTALTFVATLAFGWHYAVDAVGGALLAWALAAGLYRVLTRGSAQAAAPAAPSPVPAAPSPVPAAESPSA